MSSNIQTIIQDQIKNLIQLTIGTISIIKKLEFEKEGEETRITILTENNNIFIENQGEVLEAVQHLIRKIIHLKNPQDRSHFLLDIGYYNKNREYMLSVEIPGLAQNVIITKGKPVILIGLSGFERLYVHKMLTDVNGLQTSSVGKDDNRKMIIFPTSEVGSASLDDSYIFDILSFHNDLNIDMFKNSSKITKLIDEKKLEPQNQETDN